MQRKITVIRMPGRIIEVSIRVVDRLSRKLTPSMSDAAIVAR